MSYELMSTVKPVQTETPSDRADRSVFSIYLLKLIERGLNTCFKAET